MLQLDFALDQHACDEFIFDSPKIPSRLRLNMHRCLGHPQCSNLGSWEVSYRRAKGGVRLCIFQDWELAIFAANYICREKSRYESPVW